MNSAESPRNGNSVPGDAPYASGDPVESATTVARVSPGSNSRRRRAEMSLT